ncbi:MAG: tRNA uridine-5-carboxymethylaminomethyl(34) synthesis enzyme MnmG [Clostridia bacterium]|nr:tRNA uridine-5-carboxymethylaminomethyl(34) synthesis enzyme MnmG [Clostridia bacterium]
MTYNAGTADVAVVGAGHAGIEAALACARLGLETVLFTINLDAVGNMPCNPSIGGTGKGHLVYEIDALGGEMGYAADRVTIQSRTLNLGKGPAVHSKRVQADRQAYRIQMKHTIEQTPHLTLIQAEIVDFHCTVDDEGHKQLDSVTTKYGAVWNVRAAIFCAGTYLGGKVIVGEVSFPSGPDGMLPATELTSAMRREGIRVMRFKTGTPARVLKSSIDFTGLEEQPGEDTALAQPFSVRTDPASYADRPKTMCHIIYTNETTHTIIRENLNRSPIYSGQIHGIGPRYCPSIEDKVVRFSDKPRHQLFLEPMGMDTEEIYVQGFSSSMPEEVQRKMLASLPGMAHAQMMRTAYAIEYDCIDPTQLRPTLEFKEISGLYGAGQFNGTSGYEEAAAQGIVAGINAARKIKGEEPVILTRDTSYIGMLIDDLVTKGTNEPYRVMTSRSEYRLLLRQDNADARLTPIGHMVGLIDDARYEAFQKKQNAIEAEVHRAKSVTIPPSDRLTEICLACGTQPPATGTRLAELIRRPQLDYDALQEVDVTRPALPRIVSQNAQTLIKYEGYIAREMAEVEKFRKLEGTLLPKDTDYTQLKGIRIEAAQKLQKIRPESIGQAQRISGISPADISVLLIWLKTRGQTSNDIAANSDTDTEKADDGT